MPTSLSPTLPDESTTAVPAGGFSTWFKNISDWLKSLSPAGATQYDTGWVNSGLAITPGTNWTLGNYRCRRIGKDIWAEVALTYGGTTITADATGNAGDVVMGTMPSGWRPTAGSWRLNSGRQFISEWFGIVGPDGALVLSHGAPNATIPAGSVLTTRYNCLAD